MLDGVVHIKESSLQSHRVPPHLQALLRCWKNLPIFDQLTENGFLTGKRRFPFGKHYSGQIITTSAEVTPNGGVVRESPQNPLKSGLGIILICPDFQDPQQTLGVSRGLAFTAGTSRRSQICIGASAAEGLYSKQLASIDDR